MSAISESDATDGDGDDYQRMSNAVFPAISVTLLLAYPLLAF